MNEILMSHGDRSGTSWLTIDEEEIGHAISSPGLYYEEHHHHQYPHVSGAEREVQSPANEENNAFDPDNNDLMFDDPNAFSFTFSEEDLIPILPSWAPPEYPYPPDMAFDLPAATDQAKLYSTTDDHHVESKITIQRAFFVSEPPTPRPSTLSSTTGHDRDSITKEEKKARRVSRTFSGFRRKAKSIAAPAPMPPPSASSQTTTSPQTPRTINSPRIPQSPTHPILTQTAPLPPPPHTAQAPPEPPVPPRAEQPRPTSSGKSSRGTPKSFARSEDAVGALSFFSKSKSQDAKSSRRQSLRRDMAPPKSPSSPQASPPKRPTTPRAHSSSSSKNKLVITIPTVPAPSLADFTSVFPPAPPLPVHSPPETPKREGLRRRSIGLAPRPPPKPKDELAPVFKTLEIHHQKYLTKTTTVKCRIIETTILPFLRNTVAHASNTQLPVDMLERRCTVMEKWWTSLLDLAEDPQNSDLTNRDRSAIYDAIAGIMQRQEWRCVPEFASLSETTNAISRNNQATQSEDDIVLAEFVHRNVRNLFVQNLARQMALIVARLSSRDSRALDCHFAGLCCAYAFFFCPGLGETLASLWTVDTTIVRKVIEYAGCETPAGLRDISQSIIANFPPSMHTMCFTSIRAMSTRIKKSLSTNQEPKAIDWYNSLWIGQWNGERSDLMFVFLRHYHILLADFLPLHTSRLATTCAPGYILIQTKMMMMLRMSFMLDQDKSEPSPATPPDNLMDPDSKALAIPAAPDASRSMISRRLLVLLKDFIPGQADYPQRASELFKQNANNVLKAATRQVSLYDHDACFNLCDFLEDALPVLSAFKVSPDAAKADHDAYFWVDVFKRMLESDNTLTAMRLFALVFTCWPWLTKDRQWRDSLCYDFLLDSKVFNTCFNHWCPLVRVYFMRVLAWRVARYEKDDEHSDRMIPLTLLLRIQESWSYYKNAVAEAIEADKLTPSTAPCNPVPGRRLLIIRTDSPASTSQSSASATPKATTPYTKEKTAPGATDKDDSYFSPSQLFAKLTVTLEDSLEQGKKRSSIFRAMTSYRATENRSPPLPYANGQAVDARSLPNSPASPHTSDTSSRSSLYQVRPVQPVKESKEALKARLSAHHLNASSTSAMLGLTANFKFSLEAVDRRPNPDLALVPPRLPLAAHVAIESHPRFVKDVPASRPQGNAIATARYSGRALAEWSLAVNECQNFFERRRKEGVPSNREVETPTLGVENFRRIMP